MYYGLILISVIMFSSCFAFKDFYRSEKGSTFNASIEFTFYSSIMGLLVLLIINKFHFEFTFFTLIMATISSINALAFGFCSFKALEKINLSLFSLFSMLGGMVLPFFQGIIFYNEKITVAKIVCVCFITVALLLSIKKSDKTGGTIYYILIFVLNGMSGVISKIFTSAPYEKTSASGYSVLSALTTVILALVILLLLKQKLVLPTVKQLFASAGSGILNRIANLILVISLMHVDTSVQYPMVTGGVMICSTVICLFTKRKPTTKDIIQVILAFLGMLCLAVIPF